MLTLELPYPPTINHYYRRVGNRTLISAEGRKYRERIHAILRDLGHRELTGALAVMMTAFPPDRRRRDIDNLQKALLDALQKGGLFQDDRQVRVLLSQWGSVEPEGRVIVRVREGVRQWDNRARLTWP